MSVNEQAQVPDYELDEMIVVTAPEQLRALASDEDIAMVANIDGIATAYGESRQAKEADDLRCTLVHARIPIDEVRAFWAEVQDLARRFAQIPRSGDQVYGFVAGLYPTDAPTLPEAQGDSGPAS